MLQDFSDTGFGRFVNDVARNASEFPGWWIEQGNKFNQDLINDATKSEIEQNLRSNEAQRYAAQAGGWLSKPVNLIMAFVGVVGFLLLVRKS